MIKTVNKKLSRTNRNYIIMGLCAILLIMWVYAAVDGTFSTPIGSQSGTVTEDSSI